MIENCGHYLAEEQPERLLNAKMPEPWTGIAGL